MKVNSVNQLQTQGGVYILPEQSAEFAVKDLPKTRVQFIPNLTMLFPNCLDKDFEESAALLLLQVLSSAVGVADTQMLPLPGSGTAEPNGKIP